MNDFKHIIQGLLALDDADWRPVALVAMVKAEESRKKGVKVRGNVGPQSHGYPAATHGVM